MPPGESSCPGGSEYVWQRGSRVFQAELQAAEENKKSVFAVFRINPTPTIMEIELQWDLFATSHNFANGPHFVALAQLRATTTRSKICCTQTTLYIF